MRPTAHYRLFNDAVEVYGYGKRTSDFEESHVAQVARELEIRTILHPQTHAFNASVCGSDEFRNQTERDGVVIRHDCLADGVIIPKGQAAWLRTADCPTIVARHDDSGVVIAAHAGRASLIDQECLQTGNPSRRHESVVYAICERLLANGCYHPAGIEAFSCCGIGPIFFKHPFNHPKHGRFNRIMNTAIADRYGKECFEVVDGGVRSGALKLHQLIKNQFWRQRVSPDSIRHDSVDTAVEEEWFSRRRGDRIGHNTILVVRRV